MATYRQIWLSKNGGTEIDRDGWRELMELCPYIRFNEPVTDIEDVLTAVGGIYEIDYDVPNYLEVYWSWGTPQGGITLIDGQNGRFGAYISNFPISDALGEHYNCMYVNVSDDIVQGHTIIDGTCGLYQSNYSEPVGNFVSDWNYVCGSGDRYTSPDDCIQPDDVINGDVTFNSGNSFGNIPLQGRFLAEALTIYANMPVFLRREDLQTYIEDGTIHNCLNDVETVEEIGGNNNKYCQTEILTMDANGHNKATIYDYYYTYKMKDTQNIVGYVKDDENAQNVRFKAKDLEEPITIIDNDTGESWTVSGADFNSGFYGNSFGCSTKREHTLFGGKICWGVFGRMNIYIFDTEAKANQYLQDGDPSKAINYDDIDNYNQRDVSKTGEDAGDQTSQNNQLVTGWAEPSLSNAYILTSAKMEQVAELVFPDVTTQGELPQQIKDLKASLGLYGENPINDIIDVWHCPFNPYRFVERQTRNIWFGSYRSEISATHVTAHGKVVSLGATVISPIYNDFRDYDIEITLYLPYFGTVELPADIYVGKKLEIKATLDLRSHNVRYYIFANDTLIEYHDCAVGTCYPLMGQDVAGKANQVMHAYNNLTTAKRNATITNGMGVLSSAYKLSTGDVMGAMNGLANVQTSYNDLQNAEKNLKQDIKYTQPARSIVGNSSPACSENDIPYPYIVFKIPQTIKPPLLQSTYGLPSNVITEIGNVSGYAQIENVQLASNLPKDIKADILAKLSSGVYIN